MKYRTNRALILYLGIVLAACSDSGYYVSRFGDDNNPGTESKPFKTIARVNQLTLHPGDKVYFKGGETFEGTLAPLLLYGHARNPIYFGSYGEGKATINGGDQEAIIMKGSHFVLEKIHAKGSGRKAGNSSNGIALIDALDASVSDVETEGFQKSGLDLYNCRHATIRNVHAFNNGFSGIHVTADSITRSGNILIQDCVAENNPGDPSAFDNHSGNGILVALSDSVTIDHCSATNNGWDMPRIGNGPVGIWAYEANHVIIQYCISYRNRTAKGAKDGGGFDFDGGVRNSVIQYCLSYENEGAGYGLFQYWGASSWRNNILRYCVSINDDRATEGSGGIFVWNGSEDSSQLSDCFIYNNLVYATYAPAVMFEPKSTHRNFQFSNNIFIGRGEVVHGPSSGDTFVGNAWWHADSTISFRGYASLREWSDSTGQETLNHKLVGIQVDPLLSGPLTTELTDPHQLASLEGLKLKPGSPLRDAGIRYDLLHLLFPPADFFGGPVGSIPEPGIHQLPEN